MPTSLHPKSVQRTYTLVAFSIIPTSIEILGQAANCFCTTCSLPGRPKLSEQASKRIETSGKYCLIASIIDPAFQMKIPVFQKNSPLSTKTWASSRLGFSVNVFTDRIAPFDSSPIWIYPYPVSARVGFTPKVSREGSSSTKSIPCNMASRNTSSRRIRWSAGETIIVASGSMARIW